MIRAVPLTRDEANKYVEGHHRHHGRVTGHRFIIGAVDDTGNLLGCAIVGRPVARMIPQFECAEVTRLCTDGSKNVCSFLYSKCSRIAREMGFARIFTAILESESGTSLKAAGWRFEYLTKVDAKGWDRPSRARIVRNPGRKQIWAPSWCSPPVPIHQFVDLFNRADLTASVQSATRSVNEARKALGETR